MSVAEQTNGRPPDEDFIIIFEASPLRRFSDPVCGTKAGGHRVEAVGARGHSEGGRCAHSGECHQRQRDRAIGFLPPGQLKMSWHRSNETSKRRNCIPGVGPLLDFHL
jgi:hypothetical protein